MTNLPGSAHAIQEHKFLAQAREQLELAIADIERAQAADPVDPMEAAEEIIEKEAWATKWGSVDPANILRENLTYFQFLTWPAGYHPDDEEQS